MSFHQNDQAARGKGSDAHDVEVAALEQSWAPVREPKSLHDYDTLQALRLKTGSSDTREAASAKVDLANAVNGDLRDILNGDFDGALLSDQAQSEPWFRDAIGFAAIREGIAICRGNSQSIDGVLASLLAWLAAGKDGMASPSIRTIASVFKCSPGAAKGALDRIEASGRFVVERRTNATTIFKPRIMPADALASGQNILSVLGRKGSDAAALADTGCGQTVQGSVNSLERAAGKTVQATLHSSEAACATRSKQTVPATLHSSPVEGGQDGKLYRVDAPEILTPPAQKEVVLQGKSKGASDGGRGRLIAKPSTDGASGEAAAAVDAVAACARDPGVVALTTVAPVDGALALGCEDDVGAYVLHVCKALRVDPENRAATLLIMAKLNTAHDYWRDKPVGKNGRRGGHKTFWAYFAAVFLPKMSHQMDELAARRKVSDARIAESEAHAAATSSRLLEDATDPRRNWKL